MSTINHEEVAGTIRNALVQILAIDEAKVSIDVPLRDLGVESFELIELSYQIQLTYGIKTTWGATTANHTIATLADLILRERPASLGV